MGETGYFEQGDGAGWFAPRPPARSPWGPDMLHGRLLGGLAADAIEREHGADDLVPSRLTVDLFKSPPMVPVRVDVTPVRDGRRIRVVDATVSSADDVLARVSVVFLRSGLQPASDAWSAPDWDMPHPDELPVPEARMRMTEMRSPAGGGMRGTGQKRVWLRDHGTLVDGEDLSPFVRAAIASDYTSPLANSGSTGLGFINADITMYLRRVPHGEWIGFEVGDHLSEDGVAIARCRLYDVDGAIGFSDVCAVANARTAGPGPRR